MEGKWKGKRVLRKLSPNLADFGARISLNIAKTVNENANKGVSRLDIRLAFTWSFFKCEKDELAKDLNNTIAKDVRLRYLLNITQSLQERRQKIPRRQEERAMTWSQEAQPEEHGMQPQ